MRATSTRFEVVLCVRHAATLISHTALVSEIQLKSGLIYDD